MTVTRRYLPTIAGLLIVSMAISLGITIRSAIQTVTLLSALEKAPVDFADELSRIHQIDIDSADLRESVTYGLDLGKISDVALLGIFASLLATTLTLLFVISTFVALRRVGHDVAHASLRGAPTIPDVSTNHPSSTDNPKG